MRAAPREARTRVIWAATLMDCDALVAPQSNIVHIYHAHRDWDWPFSKDAPSGGRRRVPAVRTARRFGARQSCVRIIVIAVRTAGPRGPGAGGAAGHDGGAVRGAAGAQRRAVAAPAHTRRRAFVASCLRRALLRRTDALPQGSASAGACRSTRRRAISASPSHSRACLQQ
jgi:hypothetical protein